MRFNVLKIKLFPPSLPHHQKPSRPDFRALLLSSQEVVLGNPSWITSRCREPLIYYLACSPSLPSGERKHCQWLFISVTTGACSRTWQPQARDKDLSVLYSVSYYLCLTIKCQNVECPTSRVSPAKNEAIICYKQKKLELGTLVYNLKLKA